MFVAKTLFRVSLVLSEAILIASSVKNNSTRTKGVSFLVQVVGKTTRGGVLLFLLLTNREEQHFR